MDDHPPGFSQKKQTDSTFLPTTEFQKKDVPYVYIYICMFLFLDAWTLSKLLDETSTTFSGGNREF